MRVLSATLLVCFVAIVHGHGTVVSPRSRNSVDYLVGVNTPKVGWGWATVRARVTTTKYNWRVRVILLNMYMVAPYVSGNLAAHTYIYLKGLAGQRGLREHHRLALPQRVAWVYACVVYGCMGVCVCGCTGA